MTSGKIRPITSTDDSGWSIGILLCLLASIFGIIGKIVIKKSHLENSRNQFAVGLVLIVLLNPLCSVIAYHYAPQSLLAPMAGLTVVWNTLLTPFILHVKISLRDVLGAGCIFVGCIMVGISGGHTTYDIPINELVSHFTSFEFIAYQIVLWIALIVLVVLSWPALMTIFHHSEATTKKEYYDLSSNNSSPYGIECLKPAVLSESVSHRITRVSFVAMAGLISGQMYFLTAIMRILSDGNDIFKYGLTYVSIIGAVGVGVLGLYLLNVALKLYDAVFVIYIYESCYIVSGAVSGICFFNEMKNFSMWHYAIYTASMIQIIIGIHIISAREDDHENGSTYNNMNASADWVDPLLEKEQPIIATKEAKENYQSYT